MVEVKFWRGEKTMKRYIKPQAEIVRVNLYNSCLDDDKTYSTHDTPVFPGGGNGKQNPFGNDADDSQEQGENIWK